MTENTNPYARPVSSPATDNCQFRLDGDTVILKAGSDLPHRCVKCNAPSVESLSPTKLTWHHPGWYLSLLITPVLYILVYFMVRKSARVTIGLCPTHYRRRKMILSVTLTSMFIAFVMIAIGQSEDGNGMAVLGICLLLLIPLIGFIAASTGIRVDGINAEEVRLKGFSRAFREALGGPLWQTTSTRD